MDARIDAAAAQWKQQGWALIDGLLPADLVAEALTELQAAGVGPQPAGPFRRPDTSGGDAPDPSVEAPDPLRFRAKQFEGTTLFPIPGSPITNRLFVHPLIVACASAMLETEDLRIYQARTWSKHGSHVDYRQPLHLDSNHSLIPIRNGPGWGHVEFFVYLHDVDDTNGAPMLVPQTDVGLGIGGGGVPNPREPEQAPELYAREVSAPGSAGSVLAYRSDVWHRGTSIEADAERHIIAVSFRPANVTWIGFDPQEPMVNSPDYRVFAQACSPDELALFGIPKPGHEFWTAEVLDRMQNMYPALDLDPWRNALV